MADKFDTDKFVKDRSIAETDLTRCMAENASLLGYYGQQAAEWKSIHDNVKLQTEIRSAEIMLDLKASGAKSTDTDKKASAEIHPDVKDLKLKLIKVKEQVELYQSAVNALADRGRMLASIGAWKRSEMTSTPYHNGGVVEDATRVVVGSIPPRGGFYSGVVTPSVTPAVMPYGTSITNEAITITAGTISRPDEKLSDDRKAEILKLLNGSTTKPTAVGV